MMRKGGLLLVLTLGGLGCVNPGTHVEKESRQAPPVRMVEAPPPPPAVTADQVTEANAADAAQALAREMDWETNRQSAAAALTTMAHTMKP